ncbi:MAG: 1-acyl-sn-glycerol-3-phosphate acyltransferase [Chloroflexi bacterium]|nr:1-acyl-sn-glycerol-3-phosphate acyltransferase [Chloroflexota bacterium]
MTNPQPYVPRGWRRGTHILRFILRPLVRLDARGTDYLPELGPAILTPNHTSTTDVLFMAAIYKMPPVTLAADKWEHFPVVSWFLKHFGQAIFVNRGQVDRSALRSAMAVLKEGRLLGLAPEGTRSRDGVLQKGHDGAAWLAGRTDALIVPVAMWGHEDLTASWRRLRRPTVHIHVGEPYRLPPEARRARSRDLAQYTNIIMRNIARMLPEDQRGPYA